MKLMNINEHNNLQAVMKVPTLNFFVLKTSSALALLIN